MNPKSREVRAKLITALNEVARLGQDGLKKSRARVRSGIGLAAALSHRQWAGRSDKVKGGFEAAARLGKVGVEQGSQWMNAALATEYARAVDRYMGELFASKATIYDRAMDRVYRETPRRR